MREASSPDLTEADPLWSLPRLLAERVARDPHGTLAERSSGLGRSWIPVSAATFAKDVATVARGLIAHGVEAGDRVAIMSRTRYEWTLLDFAIWAAGAIPVPVYETSSVDQVTWICTDAGVSLAIVETAAHAATVAQAQASLDELRQVLVIDDGAITTLVEAAPKTSPDVVTQRSALATAHDVATIIYTSGTTGRPKGVELTHANFVSLALNGSRGLGEICCVPGARTLLFMPLAHVFARYIEVMCIASGAVLGHTPDTRTLLSDLSSYRPTFLLAVPRVFEKVYNSAEQKAGSGPKLQTFRWAAKVAIEFSRAQDTVHGPGLPLRVAHWIADALVYSKLRATLGGRVKYSISGGAPLGERLGHFYRGIGVRILEGYGLTETTAPSAVNRPGLTKIGTVGAPFPGALIKIADDGQIHIKGPHVFRGYHNNPEATAAALQDGWFVTGDIGTLDNDGYLRITGRLKEIIVTAGGKNVAPAVLEDRLRGHPLVSQVVVVGDGRPFIGALVTLDPDLLPGWLQSHGLEQMDTVTASRHPAVLAAIDRAVARANQAVSRAESIRKVRVLTAELSESNGYLTPSLKIKRAAVLRDFADQIDELYQDTRDSSASSR